MPTINVDKELLFQALGRTFTTAEFEDLCFDFGIELEDETSEKEIATKEVGAEKAAGLSERWIYRIDIPANRIDLLCPEGLTRALRVYLGLDVPPVYKTSLPAAPVTITVKPEVAQVRPYVVGAILRNVSFDEYAYDNFIQLQEKLHNNICRKRTLVAIGTHDLDTLTPPFTYEALPPADFSFVPLNQTKSMDGNELMKFYEADKRLSKFLPIIRDAPRYPIIFDAKKTVCSLPPIINGDHSKIKLSTKNIFIECTATDLTKAKIVLNTITTMFSQYCGDKYSIEQVLVVDAAGKKEAYPNTSSRPVDTTVSYITKSIGIDINGDQVVDLLKKMSLNAAVDPKSDKVTVQVPPTRSDILHPCDVMEDVAIAYNFNNVAKTIPKASTIAAPLKINKLSDHLRREVALAGFTEVLPLILCSHDENFAWLNKKDDGNTAVKLANPKTVEYQVVRTSLIPGLLKTVQSNRRMPLPLKLFEVSDVVFKNDAVERRSVNQRNFAALYCGKTSGFEVIHGLLDRVMAMLNVPAHKQTGFCIKESTDATFFPGRRADIHYKENKIGVFGILHPEVLDKFEVSNPCTVLEICIEPFL